MKGRIIHSMLIIAFACFSGQSNFAHPTGSGNAPSERPAVVIININPQFTNITNFTALQTTIPKSPSLQNIPLRKLSKAFFKKMGTCCFDQVRRIDFCSDDQKRCYVFLCVAGCTVMFWGTFFTLWGIFGPH